MGYAQGYADCSQNAGEIEYVYHTHEDNCYSQETIVASVVAQYNRVNGDNDNRSIKTTLTVENKTQSVSTGTFTQYGSGGSINVSSITLEDGRTISANMTYSHYQSGESGVGYRTRVTIYLYVNGKLVTQNSMNPEGDCYSEPSVTISQNLAGIGYICGKTEGSVESATIVFN